MIDFVTQQKIARMWERERNARFVAYDEAQRLVILADAADVPVLQEQAQAWAAQGKLITWIIYTVTHPRVESPLPGNTIYICRRWGGLKPLPSPQEAKACSKVDAEVLINLAPRQHATLQYVAAMMPTPMKIGLVDTLQQKVHYDLAIRRNDNPGAVMLLQDIMLYWSKIAGSNTL